MFRFRTPTLLAAAVALMLVALSGPVAAGSPFVENYSDKGRGGFAGNGDCSFDPGTGDESCWFVDVFAQDGWMKANGERIKGETICVTRGTYEYDGQSDTFVDILEQGCSQASVSVAKNLSSASASGTVRLERCKYTESSDACIPLGSRDLGLDLRWNAVEPAFSNRGRFTDTFGECTLKEQFRGTIRPAEVSGTVDGYRLWGDIGEGASKFSVRCH